MGSRRGRTARPFLKWAGGKSQLLDQMHPYFPDRFRRYFEPFLGGGAVFFHLAPKRATLADSNPDLIAAFLAVRDNPVALMSALDRHSRQRSTQEHYYRVRSIDPSNLSPVDRAARAVFLNKTCFNGLFRVNSAGQFNVPWGRYKNPVLYDRPNILAASAMLRGSRIMLADYRRACRTASLNDFVYLDPPYHPISRTSGFTSYTKEDFDDDGQRGLAETFRELDRRGVLLMLSNSSTPMVRSLYSGFRMETLRAKRAINSKGSGRGAVDELLIMNYG